MGGRWPNSSCFVGCCFQDLFNITCSILVQLQSSFFSIRLASIQVVHPYIYGYNHSLEKNRFILLERSDFYMTGSLSIAVHALLHIDVIFPAVRVFANGPGDLGSIPGRVIPKTLKMVLDTTLLNTQHYKVRFKGKVEQSWEWSSALPYTLV